METADGTLIGRRGQRLGRRVSSAVHPRRGLASEEPPGRPGNGWRGLSGLDSGSAAFAGAGMREERDLSASCSLTPFPRHRMPGSFPEAPQRLGSGARPRSLEGRLSGTGWNHRKWLERHRGGFVKVLQPASVFPTEECGLSASCNLKPFVDHVPN